MIKKRKENSKLRASQFLRIARIWPSKIKSRNQRKIRHQIKSNLIHSIFSHLCPARVSVYGRERGCRVHAESGERVVVTICYSSHFVCKWNGWGFSVWPLIRSCYKNVFNVRPKTKHSNPTIQKRLTTWWLQLIVELNFLLHSHLCGGAIQCLRLHSRWFQRFSSLHAAKWKKSELFEMKKTWKRIPQQ